MDYQKRIEKVRDVLDKKDIPAVIIKCPSNIFYLTGLLEIEGVLVIDRKGTTLFVPSLYYQETVDLLPLNIENVVYKKSTLKTFLKRYKKVGFIGTDLTFSTYMSMSKEHKLVLLPDFLKKIRMVKETEEIVLIKKALEINRKVLKDIRAYIENGEEETVIAGRIHYLIRRYGGRREAFEPIVASGIASSYPHHKNRNIKIEKGSPVVVDAGVDYGGYKSDLTQTFLSGCPNRKFVDIYKVLTEVQKKVIEFIKVGMTGADIHIYAVSLLKKKGMDRYFIHGLGHGVGIDIHELPVLAPGSKDVIEDGCVFTIEPGIYVPGEGGIRLEDMVIM
ncbi:MAG: Xaa-Pro peptidase family protein [Candidatus Ratteibacteria bacterium]|nr:Xaa-Pro peptidase family protein [Candidatus Ratteibacteria bacterium]